MPATRLILACLFTLALAAVAAPPASADADKATVDRLLMLARGYSTPQQAVELVRGYQALDQHDQYGELDAIQAALRGGASDPSKRPCLQYFYAILLGRTARMPRPEAIELRKKWLAARPDSVAARVLLAEAHLDHAHEARGNGAALTLDLEQVREMHKRAEVAEKLLREAADSPQADAQVFASTVRTARYLEYPFDKTDRAFDRAVALDKRYTPAYQQMAIYLLPRWYGKAGDLGTFVRRTVKLRGDSIGCADVASITYPFEKKQLFSYDGVSWSMVKAGLEQQLNTLPDQGPAYTEAMNCLAALACLADDRPTACEAFQRLGKRADATYFKSIGTLDQWRTWAFK